MIRLRITPNHLILLKELTICSVDGSVAIDGKRPFGNSNISGDVADLIGMDLDENEANIDYCWDLYADLEHALQILCHNLSIQEGVYVRANSLYDTKWELQK